MCGFLACITCWWRARGDPSSHLPLCLRPQVRKSMARIKGVLTERLAEHEDPAVRLQLKAFIDGL